jgi:hypothetical protein
MAAVLKKRACHPCFNDVTDVHVKLHFIPPKRRLSLPNEDFGRRNKR